MARGDPQPRRITSPQNPRIKAAARLRARSAERRRTGRFTVETARELIRALDAGIEPVELYALPDRLENPAVERAARRGAELFEINERTLKRLAYRQNPEGLVAVLAAQPTLLEDWERASIGEGGAPEPGPEQAVVCSGLEKPGNLGAILRTADAAGATAVLVDRERPDLFNPNCIRASTGAVFRMPIVCAPPENLIEALRRRNLAVFALTGDGEADYVEADLTRPRALVLGAEDAGLDPRWREAADARLAIPMLGGAVDSLNVSTAAAVALFEAARQRRVAQR
jgi:TrmH family RNA methyltransferase